MKTAIALLIVLSVLVLAGCSGLSEEEAQDLFCQNLATLGYASARLSNLDATSPVKDVQDAVRLYRDALSNVRWSALDVKDVEIGDLEDAIANLRKTINGIEGDDAIGDAVTAVQADWQAVVDAYNGVYSNMRCVYVITVLDTSAGDSSIEGASLEPTETPDSD